MNSDDIYRDIKARIDGGKLAVGDICPSENELCGTWCVARGTVRKALKRLSQEGYLEVAQGRPRIVRLPVVEPATRLRLGPDQPLHLCKLRSHSTQYTPSFGEHLARLGREPGWEPRDDVLESPKLVVCSRLHQVARFDVADIAEHLCLRKSRDRVVWFLRRRVGKGLPLVLQWVVVPARLVPEVRYDDLHPGGLTKLYREKYGIEREGVEAHYRPILASRDEATMLRIERGSALIEERRTSFCLPPLASAQTADDLVPYEYLLTLYTDRVSLDFSWSDAE